MKPVPDSHNEEFGPSEEPPLEPKQLAQDLLVLDDHSNRNGRFCEKRKDDASGRQLLRTPPDLALCKYAGEVDQDSRMLIFSCTAHPRLL